MGNESTGPRLWFLRTMFLLSVVIPVSWPGSALAAIDDTYIYFEAEDGDLSGPMSAITDAATYSGSRAIQVPNGQNPTPQDYSATSPYGQATYILRVPFDKTYYVYLRGKATGNSPLAGGSQFRFIIAEGSGVQPVAEQVVTFGISLDWMLVSSTGFSLKPGINYALGVISEGEQDGAILDRILVTDRTPQTFTVITARTGSLSAESSITAQPGYGVWEKQGITPFGYYFKNRSEYISPANGVLNVRYTLFSVPGRGDLLNVSLRKTSPDMSKFRYTESYLPSPYEGWTLDLPRLTDTRVYLPGGGAYEISWKDDTLDRRRYDNHKSAHFTVYQNGYWETWTIWGVQVWRNFRPSSYDLYIPDGTRYHFEHGGRYRLQFYADRKGNRVDLNYDPVSGRLSSMVDATGVRKIVFGYDASSGYLNSASLQADGYPTTRTYQLRRDVNTETLTITDPNQLQTVYSHAYTSDKYVYEVRYPSGGKSYYRYGQLEGSQRWAVTDQYIYPSRDDASQYVHNNFSYTTDPNNMFLIDQTVVTTERKLATDASPVKMREMPHFINDDGQVVSEGTKDASGNLLQWRNHVYDDNEQITSIRDYGYLASTQQLRLTTDRTYDDWGNVTSLTETTTDNPVVIRRRYYSYANTDSNGTFNVPAGGPTFTNSFYSSTVPAEVHDLPAGYAEAFGSQKAETYFWYYGNGNLREKKEKDGSRWTYTSYEYDTYGNVQKVIHDSTGSPKTTEYRYDTAYHGAYLTKEINVFADLMVDRAQYPNVTVEDIYGYDFVPGNLTSSTIRVLANGIEKVPEPRYSTSFEYDNIDRLRKVYFPIVPPETSNAYAEAQYDDAARTMTFYDELRRSKVVRTFDGLDRLVKVETYRNITDVTPELTKSYTYNWLDQKETETVSFTFTPAGSTSPVTYNYNTTYEYDALGRSTKELHSDGTFIKTEYEKNRQGIKDLAVTTIYDERNADFPGYYMKELVHDFLGRLKEVREFPQVPPFTPTAVVTAYSYDEAGHLTSVTNAKNYTTSYQYDDMGRVWLTTYADSRSLKNEYDGHGNIQRVTKPDGQVLTYEYDELNRLKKVNLQGMAITELAYDPLGNKAQVKNDLSGVLTSYMYDERNRLKQKVATIDGKSFTLNYAYDAAGNLASLASPDGRTTTYEYDNLNRLDLLKLGVGASTTAVADYTFRPDSLVDSVLLGNGVRVTPGYNNSPRLDTIAAARGATELFRWTYGYDKAGNITIIEYGDVARTIGDTFTYDGLMRLREATMLMEAKP